MSLMQTRRIGDVRITRVLEYSGPTHDPAQLFPTLPEAEVERLGRMVGPAHYVPAVNRLVVTNQVWVVHAGTNVILVDTGVGNFKPRRIPRMDMLNTVTLPWLEAAGAGRDAVTHVIHTHLHVDHVGWNTVHEGGRWVPTFPNARYVMPKLDFDFFQAQVAAGFSPLVDGSFADSVMPVVEAGLVEFVAEAGEVADCLAIEPAPGHCPGMLTFRLRSGGEEAIFSADVMHSPVQVSTPELNTAYCSDPGQARATRAALLARAATREALIMPAHFGAPYCGYIRRQGDGYAFEPAEWP